MKFSNLAYVFKILLKLCLLGSEGYLKNLKWLQDLLSEDSVFYPDISSRQIFVKYLQDAVKKSKLGKDLVFVLSDQYQDSEIQQIIKDNIYNFGIR